MRGAAAGQRFAVIGTGLIGGSILLRLDRAGAAAVGWDPSAQTRSDGRAQGLTFADTLADAVRDADLVFLSGPLTSLPETLSEVVALSPETCTITDVGSTKAGLSDLAAARGLLGRFVPGHPMAGTEKAGLAAADPDLLRGVPWVLCPDERTPLRRYRALAAVVTALFEAQVVPMPADLHDAVAALSSHIPHVLAGALAGAVADSAVRAGVLTLAAGSFRDGTRVAGAPSRRTVDMIVANRGAVLDQFRLVRDALSEIVDSLERTDTAALLDRFEAGHELRAGLFSRVLKQVDASFDTTGDDRAEFDFLTATGRAGGYLTACEVGAGRVDYAAHLPT